MTVIVLVVLICVIAGGLLWWGYSELAKGMKNL